MEKFVKILKKLFPFTIILILVYFIPPVFILVQQEEEVIERMLTADVYKRQASHFSFLARRAKKHLY